jgi:heme-degrading monooxygenase HmoA
MAFCVINAVKAPKDELPAIVLDVQRLGLEALRMQPGFKLARLVVSEEGTEAMLIIEWVTRDDFVAYRQSDVGRRLVESALRLHPQISFYEVIASFDAEPGS